MPDLESVVSTTGGARNPLVSIIIPCYNCRAFIGEAIESALAQTYKRIEVVVVDDGSEDGTAAIAQSYPVRFVQETHQGVSAARNRAIQTSVGEYLVFLDGDDRLLPGAVAAGLATLERDPICGMAVGGHRIVTQSGELIATKNKPVHLRDGYELLLRSNFIECTSSIMVRRACLTDDIVFRPNLSGAEDYDLYLRVARNAPIACHTQIVAEYRLHSSNASRDSKMMLSHTLKALSQQWPFARRSMRYRLAYLSGSLFWRRKYGRQLTMEMAMSESKSRPQEQRTAWRLLASSYPQGMLVVLISRMFPKNLVRSVLQRATRRVRPAKTINFAA